jgi:ribosome-binding protein aMBF1 (putative translation factor)
MLAASGWQTAYPKLGYSQSRITDTGPDTEPATLKSLRSAEHVRLTQYLVNARERAGMTQQQLADKLGKHQSFVAKYEGGERRIDVIEFLHIARALGFDASRAIRFIEKR